MEEVGVGGRGVGVEVGDSNSLCDLRFAHELISSAQLVYSSAAWLRLEAHSRQVSMATSLSHSSEVVGAFQLVGKLAISHCMERFKDAKNPYSLAMVHSGTQHPCPCGATPLMMISPFALRATCPAHLVHVSPAPPICCHVSPATPRPCMFQGWSAHVTWHVAHGTWHPRSNPLAP